MEDKLLWANIAELQFIGNDKQPESLDIDLCEVAVYYEFVKELRVGDLLQLFKNPGDENFTPVFWITHRDFNEQLPYNKFSGHAYEVIGRRWNVGFSNSKESNFLTVELTWKTGI